MPPRKKKAPAQPIAPQEPTPPVSFVKDEALAAREREKMHGQFNFLASAVLGVQNQLTPLTPVSIRPVMFKDDEYPEVSLEVSSGNQTLQSHVGWAIDKEGVYPTKVKSEVSGTLCNTLQGALHYQAALAAIVQLTQLVEGYFADYQRDNAVTREEFYKR
jgi:hypothetical protein